MHTCIHATMYTSINIVQQQPTWQTITAKPTKVSPEEVALLGMYVYFLHHEQFFYTFKVASETDVSLQNNAEQRSTHLSVCSSPVFVSVSGRD